jgi:hypothetical protein
MKARVVPRRYDVDGEGIDIDHLEAHVMNSRTQIAATLNVRPFHSSLAIFDHCHQKVGVLRIALTPFCPVDWR